MSQILTTVGLLLDIVGVCMIFYFTLHSRYGPHPWGSFKFNATSEEREKERKQNLKNQRASRRRRFGNKYGSLAGLVVLVVGFGLQIVGAWWPGLLCRV